jgi:peptidoglycan/LPS O-acetylase OafA/YrhL
VSTFTDNRPLESAPSPTKADDLPAHRPALAALTGVRFFAAFYVVICHTHIAELLDSHQAHSAALFLRHGALSVVLFFILSGMILSYTYQGHLKSGRGIRRFYEARVARVWPLYVISLLLSSVVNHTTPHPAVALATLLMVQAWNPWNTAMAGTWNFVCWTLSTEALFYLIFPFSQRCLERHSQRLLAILLAMLLLVSVGLRTALHGFSTSVQWSNVPLALIHIPEFLVGVCLGNIYNKLCAVGGLPSRLPLPAGAWTTLAAVASVVCLCSSRDWVLAFSTACFASLLYGLASEPSKLRSLLSTKVLLVGGQISYGLYLLQWPVKEAVHRVTGSLHLSAVVSSSLYFVILLVVSTAGFFGVEEPARKLIRSTFSRS